MAYLEAYEQLDRRRPEGFASAQPIPIVEMEAWARIFWPLDIERFVARMIEMDAVHRGWLAERAKEQADAHDQAQPPRNPRGG